MMRFVGCDTSEIHNRVIVCPCVYVKAIMFMKAKSKNGQYVSPLQSLKKKVIKSHGIVLIFFCDWVCLYINTSNNLKSLTI